MAFGPEVGSVSVRVMPDTRGFRGEANRQLKAIKDQLKELKVKLVVDAKGFEKATKKYEKKPVKAPVKADFDQFQKKALADLKKLAVKLEAKIPLTPDGEKMREKLAKDLKDVEGRIKATVPVDAELASEARRQIRRDMIRMAKEMEVKPIEVPVASNTRTARAQIRELIADIPKYAESGAALNVNLAKDHTKNELRGLIAELKAEAALAGVDINVNIDTPVMKRGAIAASQLGTSLSRAAKSGGGLSTISRWGLILAAGLSLAAPVVGLIVGLLSSLPALLSSILGGVFAVALGMDGIKKAAEPLKPLLDELKGKVSEVFATKLPPIFDQLKSLIPTITSGMTGIADGLVNMFSGVANALTSGAGIGHLNTLLQNTAGLFNLLKPAAETFTATFLQVGAAGSEQFGRLAQVINTFASQMSGVMTNLIDTGAFAGAIEGMSQAVQGFLTLFARLFEAGAPAMAKLGQPLNNMFSGVGDLLVALMPALTSFSGLLGNLIGSLGSSLAPVITALTPAFTALTDVLGPVLTGVFEALSPVLTEVATLFGGVLLAALQALQPYLPQIMTAVQQLGQAFTEAFAMLGPPLIQVIQMLLPVLLQLIPPILQVVQALLPLIPAAGMVAAALARILLALSPLISGLGQLIAGLAGGIAKFIEFGANIVTIVASALSIVLSKIADWATQFISFITEGVSGAVRKLEEFGAQAVSAITSKVGEMGQAGVDLIMGLVGGLGRAIGRAVAKAREVASSIVSAVKGIFNSNSPSKVFMGIGNDVVDGLTIGIGEKQNAATTQAANMAQGVVDSASKVIADGVDPLTIDVQLDPAALQKLKEEKDLLDLQVKALAVEKDRAPDKMAKAGLQAQLDQINARRREISLIQEQAEYQKKYGQEVESTQEKYSTQLNNMAKIPYDFAKTTANSFMSDLGISGNGALPALANWGLDMGSKFIFNVGGTDQAISMQQNIQRKEAAVRY